MTMALWLAMAMVLDAILGEPRWLWSRVPHPAVLMGRAVGALDRGLNRGAARRAKGVLALALLVLGAGGLGWLLALAGPVVEILGAAILLAQRSLAQHVRAVAGGLRQGLPEGRKAVAMIVSRDTAAMDAPRIARSAIESAAENLSDGVIAPAFWFLFGGLPGILIYKMVNTADSMIGYRTPRHEAFGWAAARTDDLLNLLPARLTALMIALPSARRMLPVLGPIADDARAHKSPNAGWPEATMARVLDVALSGPRSYDGQMRDLAWVNPDGRREIGADEVDAAVSSLWSSWVVALLLVLFLVLVQAGAISGTGSSMRSLIFAFATALSAGPLAAQCGGDFSGFIGGLKDEAQALGHAPATVDAFFRTARQDPAVLRADRAQGVFQRPFLDFSRRLISQNRIDRGRQNASRYASVFDAIEAQYGVSRGVLLAFWAFETDYGAVQGDFNTLNALVTLAHDCRRPELFRPQVFAALELYEHGDFDPATTTGAWAGEIGMVQMLPGDILENGVDGDGDGHVRLKSSAPDALMSGGQLLSSLGWRAGEPWIQEVVVPDGLDWSLSGPGKPRPSREWQAMGVTAREGQLADLPASLVLPQGRNGPAFLAYPNFDVYFEWNQSFVYVMTAAYFATRLEGAPIYLAGDPDPGLSGEQMKALQQKLAARGHDVGGIDGILGAGTRAAVQAEQTRLGMPADAWPTAALLNAL